ncbi:hypothetical protein E4U42_008097 [Claviceps africana]|uniref:MADS-box MEF2 type transcription factor MIG1 n=1 Tax=Claviceps africana TaxID=83212 RepID=A0A8K0NEU6_9HYPO|nr:hypothetical protein E4U42_008097 [Claviceps africana]
MGRRKIEIKAIKDDRNRSVTFLKRKGGLFKKAHELSVLCSVDVAVFIFGNNKKLYEYSSVDMRDLINRYQYHGGFSEHKGPADFSGGNEDDEDEDGDGTPPRGHDVVEHQMMPPQFPGHQQPPFPQIRHHTPSASPPIPSGAQFQTHPGHPGPRGNTPQPMGSRPGSRNDMRSIGPPMVPQPHGPHPGISYMPTPPIYQSSAPAVGSGQQPPSQYSSYPPPQKQQQQPSPPPPPLPQQQQPPQQPPHQQQQQQQQQQPPVQQPQYMDDRRPSLPPSYPHQPPSFQGVSSILRTDAAPSQATTHHQMPPMHSGPHISPPPHRERRFQSLPQPPPPFDASMESSDRPQRLLLNTDTAIKKMPQKKAHSIFTPVEENRSILSQHLASFTSESPATVKPDPAASELIRSQSVDVSARGGGSSASPQSKRSNIPTSMDKSRAASTPSLGAERSFTPPSGSNKLKIGGPGAGSRPRGPRLTVQIPDGVSEHGSAGAESRSPHGSVITPTQAPRHNSVVLPPPPPSPSASALLSAGATGPPNPFARPPPQQTVNGETPVSALPSRFLHNDLLPSPSNFYPEWSYRGHDSNTLPSPLNFATPVVGTGPSFLREDHHGNGGHGGPVNHGSTSNNHHYSSGHSGSATSAAAVPASLTATSGVGGPGPVPPGLAKRKSPECDGKGTRYGDNNHGGIDEAKRVKVE